MGKTSEPDTDWKHRLQYLVEEDVANQKEAEELREKRRLYHLAIDAWHDLAQVWMLNVATEKTGRSGQSCDDELNNAIDKVVSSSALAGMTDAICEAASKFQPYASASNTHQQEATGLVLHLVSDRIKTAKNIEPDIADHLCSGMGHFFKFSSNDIQDLIRCISEWESRCEECGEIRQLIPNLSEHVKRGCNHCLNQAGSTESRQVKLTLVDLLGANMVVQLKSLAQRLEVYQSLPVHSVWLCVSDKGPGYDHKSQTTSWAKGDKIGGGDNQLTSNDIRSASHVSVHSVLTKQSKEPGKWGLPKAVTPLVDTLSDSAGIFKSVEFPNLRVGPTVELKGFVPLGMRPSPTELRRGYSGNQRSFIFAL